MDGSTLYIFCILGAIGLFLLMKRGGVPVTMLGSVFGLAGVAGLFGALLNLADDSFSINLLFYAFAGFALACAIKMITHNRPVYSAIYFILVVLSSAALFLMLHAEFMAFALVIIYAGAILITYMFVLMLAQQSPNPDDEQGQPEYDRFAREPAAGAVVGFILLALLSQMVMDGVANGLNEPSPQVARQLAWNDLTAMPQLMHSHVEAVESEPFTLGWGDDASPLVMAGSEAEIRYTIDETGETRALTLTADHIPSNVQRVGLGLIVKFQDGQLELAGIILLMAMFGAVVLARKQIELTEDEKREAAGLPRHGHEDDVEATASGEGTA